jgi:hypothetical protein
MILRFIARASALVSLSVVAPLYALAADAGTFVALSPDLPIGNSWTSGGLSGFLNNMLGLSVAIAAGLAIIMLAIGGFKYMTTDSVFSMGSAKEQIGDAIIGLLIVLLAVLLLSTINPDLVSLKIFNRP